MQLWLSSSITATPDIGRRALLPQRSFTTIHFIVSFSAAPPTPPPLPPPFSFSPPLLSYAAIILSRQGVDVKAACHVCADCRGPGSAAAHSMSAAVWRVLDNTDGPVLSSLYCSCGRNNKLCGWDEECAWFRYKLTNILINYIKIKLVGYPRLNFNVWRRFCHFSMSHPVAPVAT